MSEATHKTVRDIIYNANRKASMRGPASRSLVVYIGWNTIVKNHIVSVVDHANPTASSAIFMVDPRGTFKTKEQLLDAAMEVAELHNCTLVVYKEPNYSTPPKNSNE